MEGLTHRVICATGEKVAGAEALKVAKEQREKEKWKLEAQLNAGGKDEVTEMKTRERDRGHICVKRNCTGRQKMVSATGWVLSQIAYLIKAYLTEEKK